MKIGTAMSYKELIPNSKLLYDPLSDRRITGVYRNLYTSFLSRFEKDVGKYNAYDVWCRTNGVF